MIANNQIENLEKRMRGNAWIISFAISILWILYASFLELNISLTTLSSIIAGTAGTLLAFSFSLSSFGYYFDIFDRWILYRKYFGLTGYYWALAYTIITVSSNSQFYIFNFKENFFTPELGLGFVAMLIFTGMAFISNNRAMQFIGPQLWRQLLGLGYIAYALLILRGVLLDSDIWTQWFYSSYQFPSIRILLSIIGLSVLFFRISVPLHKFTKKALRQSIL